jgi:ABC-type nitrate/sulfonate/bicarbonate transport system substrate-binding protein
MRRGLRRSNSNVLRHFVEAALVTAAVLAGTCVSASAVETLSLTVTGKGSTNEWPIYIAEAKGLFADAGLKIDLIATQSTASQIQQIAAGSSGMGVGAGLTDPLRAIDKGANIALLRSQVVVPPYSLWGKAGLKAFDDLRKKTIVVGGAKDITRIYFDRMVNPNGLKKGDYDLVYAGTTPARYAALSSGAVDAAILLPPFSFRAAADGYSLIGRLSDYVKDMPFTGMVVNVDWAAKNKPVILSFLKIYDEAVDLFYRKDFRDEAIRIYVNASGSSQADAEKSYDYLADIGAYSRSGALDAGSIATLVKAIGDEGDFTGSAEPARFIRPEIVGLVRQAK